MISFLRRVDVLSPSSKALTSVLYAGLRPKTLGLSLGREAAKDEVWIVERVDEVLI